MSSRRSVPLAPLTTFRIGGPAHLFIEAHTEKEVEEAIADAREEGLSLYPLGAGSNVLVPDKGIEGVVLKMAMRDMAYEDDGGGVLLVAGAGALWEDIVDAASVRGLFGIENLAGIPGTVGGAAVQNIGAYGAELANVFAYADVIESITGVHSRVSRAEALFAYRTSFFKRHRTGVITRVALHLARAPALPFAHPDLLHARTAGAPLSTPADIARAVRAIRAKKFPAVGEEGTAGSFFKNPVLSRECAASLTERFPGLPAFPAENDMVKISLAWFLDHILSLNGFAMGRVRLYEKQPLVIVARAGATAAEVNALAAEVAKRVTDAIGIEIEREVESFGMR